MSDSAHDLLLQGLGDGGWGWAVGVLGGIAEFTRSPWESARRIPGGMVTARGGIALRADPIAKLVAHEALSRRAGHWQQGLTLCLATRDAALGEAHGVVTELGPDDEPLRPRDGGATLFDMGLGFGHLRACVRTAQPDLLAALRAGCGRPLFDHGSPAGPAIVQASPHRVFITALARIEVYQPIPPPDGRSPEGPHTHILPALLRSRRTHAATTHLPEGLVPVLDAFPPHPLSDLLGNAAPFDAARHAAFQRIMQRFGSPGALGEKRGVMAALRARLPPHALPEPETREARTARRVALRQASHTMPTNQVLPAWRAAWDGHEPEVTETMEAVPGHG